jgi:hypothetical protein
MGLPGETTETLSVLWNAAPIKVGAAFPPARPEDFPERGFDRSELGFVRERATPYVRQVLDRVQLEGERRFVIVDLRLSWIERGKRPGLLGWHMDTVSDPAHPTPPEVHHLFVTGTASLTEFLAEPVRLDVPLGLSPRATMRAIDSMLEKEVATLRVPSCQIVTYGRFHLHRATPGLHEERRMLLRVTETDVLRPCNRMV